MIKKILVSQPKPSSEKSPYYDIASKYDVELVFRPFIKVEGITAKEFRTQKVNILDYTAIVFTSRHAIDHFFTLAKELRVNIPEDMKYFCVTETISLYIQKYVQYRKRKVFFGTTGKIDDLLPTMVKHKTEKYLHFRTCYGTGCPRCRPASRPGGSFREVSFHDGCPAALPFDNGRLNG